MRRVMTRPTDRAKHDEKMRRVMARLQPFALENKPKVYYGSGNDRFGYDYHSYATRINEQCPQVERDVKALQTEMVIPYGSREQTVIQNFLCESVPFLCKPDCSHRACIVSLPYPLLPTANTTQHLLLFKARVEPQLPTSKRIRRKVYSDVKTRTKTESALCDRAPPRPRAGLVRRVVQPALNALQITEVKEGPVSRYFQHRVFFQDDWMDRNISPVRIDSVLHAIDDKDTLLWIIRGAYRCKSM